jgi:iron only hydrogenase large subunit-like protein
MYNTREVDCVLTPGEIVDLMDEHGISWDSLSESDIDGLDKVYTNISPHSGRVLGPVKAEGGSGGYAEYIFKYAAKEIFGVVHDEPLVYHPGRNPDMKEISLEVGGEKVLTFALAYGFRNIQTILRKMKQNKCPYDYVEIMACPSGCLNGGGQVRPADVRLAKEIAVNVGVLFHDLDVQSPDENEVVQSIYEDLKAMGVSTNDLFHTNYHAVPTFDNPLTMTEKYLFNFQS